MRPGSTLAGTGCKQHQKSSPQPLFVIEALAAAEQEVNARWPPERSQLLLQPAVSSFQAKSSASTWTSRDMQYLSMREIPHQLHCERSPVTGSEPP